MIARPNKGVSRSVSIHNIDLETFCDWIEASVLFEDGELSKSDVIDVLLENNIYSDQDFAAEIIGSAWSELKRRHLCLASGSPLTFQGQRISARGSWRDDAGHSFCLFLAVKALYEGWIAAFGHDFTEQGELFELLTKESAEAQFEGWTLHLTGWSRSNPNDLQTVVATVAGIVGEPVGEVERWTTDSANEAGLDLLLARTFPDARVGGPVYLFQCASGADWRKKLHTPELKVWRRVVNFTAEPKRAFATPYAFTDGEFVRVCNLVDGMLMDRYRLLSACAHDPDWMSGNLKRRIIAWMEPRVEYLLSLQV
jgi:hypothetical protein